MKQPNIFKRWIAFFKAWYWNVQYDLPRDKQRSKVDMLKWFFLYPWYRFLGKLARAGFLKTPENAYIRLRDFTPFFWRTLLDRQRNYYERQLRGQQQEARALLEEARRNAQEEVFEYIEKHIGKSI